MSDKIQLGQLIETEQNRDAIHIAVAPVVAAHTLPPGCHVGFLLDGTASSAAEPYIGIVDPFLTKCVRKGDRFFLLLYPNTITGLRHEWTHPAFAAPTPSPSKPQAIADAEKWLRNFADSWSMNYEDMISEAVSAGTICAGTDLYSREELGDDWGRFWDNLQVVTGKVFNHDHRESVSFRCSC